MSVFGGKRTHSRFRGNDANDPERSVICENLMALLALRVLRLAPEDIEMLSVGLFSFKVASGEASQGSARHAGE